MKAKLFSVEISSDAQTDFETSFAYYYKGSPKVAGDFLVKIDLAFEHIRENPNLFPVVYKNVRKYVVKKFPFVIYYQIFEAKVRVIAIFHSSRNPVVWSDRV